MQRYNAVNKMAEKVAQKDFKPYGHKAEDFVAPVNAMQREGMQEVAGADAIAQPYYDQAADWMKQGAGTAAPKDLDIERWRSPYTQNVVDKTAAVIDQGNEISMSGSLGDAIRNGGFGGDRSGIAAAVLAGQQSMARGKTLGDLYESGYNNAVGVAQGQQGIDLASRQADLARLSQTGQSFANLGTQAQQNALQAGEAQINAGTLQQQTDQAGKTALYQQFMQKQGFPFQVAQFLANIAMGTGSLSGSTTTTEQPSSFWGSDRRLKHDVRRIGKTDDGMPIYRFKYKGDDSDRTYIGLMADEVEKRKPEAVAESKDGYKMVDYDKATKADGGAVGPYGTPAQNANPGTTGYVPQGYLDVRELMTADPSLLQNDQQSLAQALEAAGNFGKNIVGLKDTFGKMQGWISDQPSTETTTAPTSAHGGRINYRAFGGPVDSDADYLDQPEQSATPEPISYVKGTLDEQEEDTANRANLQTAQPAPPPPSGASQVGGMASGLGSLASGVASLFALSDRRTKHDIKRIGYTDHGLPIHSFKYKGDDSERTHIGFIADEVERRDPGAVKTIDGMKHVDYARASEAKAYGGGVRGRQHFEAGGWTEDPDTMEARLQDAEADRMRSLGTPVMPTPDQARLEPITLGTRRLDPNALTGGQPKLPPTDWNSPEILERLDAVRRARTRLETQFMGDITDRSYEPATLLAGATDANTRRRQFEANTQPTQRITEPLPTNTPLTDYALRRNAVDASKRRNDFEDATDATSTPIDRKVPPRFHLGGDDNVYPDTPRTPPSGAQDEQPIVPAKPKYDAFEIAMAPVSREEGSKFVKDDYGHGAVKYGISQKWHPGIDVKNLTADKAKEIYRSEYWNGINGDEVAAKYGQEFANAAFKLSVMASPRVSKQMIERSGGDVEKLTTLFKDYLAGAAKKNSYGQDVKTAWDERTKTFKPLSDEEITEIYANQNDPDRANYLFPDGKPKTLADAKVPTTDNQPKPLTLGDVNAVRPELTAGYHFSDLDGITPIADKRQTVKSQGDTDEGQDEYDTEIADLNAKADEAKAKKSLGDADQAVQPLETVSVKEQPVVTTAKTADEKPLVSVDSPKQEKRVLRPDASVKEIHNYIVYAAKRRGIDPRKALKIAYGEGLGAGVWQARDTSTGRRETSYGPFQLKVGGKGTGFKPGMGNDMINDTGLNPSERKNLQAGIDYALDQALVKGWQPWQNTIKKLGMSVWDGIPKDGKPLKEYASSAVNLADDVTGSVVDTGKTIIDAAGNVVRATPNAAKNIADTTGEFVTNTGSSMKDFIKRNATNEDFLLSVLSGIGTMASSPSRYLGASILQGIGGAANTYAGLKKQAADIRLTNSQASREMVNAMRDGIFTDAYNNSIVLTTKGPMEYYEWKAMKSPPPQIYGQQAADQAQQFINDQRTHSLRARGTGTAEACQGGWRGVGAGVRRGYPVGHRFQQNSGRHFNGGCQKREDR
jgi:hypothetical protein